MLGAGVAILLDAALGSDGYSTLISGLTSTSGLPFVVVNLGVGILLIALAWSRGTRPGVGTVVQTVVVGGTVSAVAPLLPTPDSLGPRFVELAIAFVLLSLGVAGYLASHTGAGPAEGAAIAFDPPLPFKWSYTVLQAVSALGGWALGAAVGPGTLHRVAVRRPRRRPAHPGAVPQPQGLRVAHPGAAGRTLRSRTRAQPAVTAYLRWVTSGPRTTRTCSSLATGPCGPNNG